MKKINKIEFFSPQKSTKNKIKKKISFCQTNKSHKRAISVSRSTRSNGSFNNNSKMNNSNMSFTTYTSKKTNNHNSFANLYQLSCENLINKVKRNVVDKFRYKNQIYKINII